MFVKQKVKQAGLDPELMQKNPALAISKLVTAFNPDLEVVKVDDDRGIITVYNKKDNKTLTINLEDAASISNDTSNLHKALNIVKGEFIMD